MSLKKYLLAGGLSTVLILGACNGDDTATEEETDDTATEETDDGAADDAADDEEEEDTTEDTDTEDDSSADDEEEEEEGTDDESADEESGDGEITYSGEYGDFTFASFEQYTLEPEEAEEEAEEEEEEEEEAEPTELVLVEYEFTNNSDVPTSPEEAFGLDLAVRQMAETGESTLENLTMDLPDDHESADLAAQSVELVEPGDSATALVAYGPVDTSLETVLQSRNDEELNETIELEGGDEAADDEEEEDEEESEE
ncbi:hypothetical protein [Lacicoccus qingdaonensis]|uniref:DUF5067 domain-containing protein n=1 Tax=Lacicoccus qingdaonensis TaxID=576118 RepID=A0A1G9FWI6_9BACL|nr:hypothetical protein [Salinicoccus qingdaonensis]SDK92754.1 hypothetical protein SAMN05216216_11440 [Salinicoccus qingdaonensis]